ncbi:MAG TPA: hypothetical protein VN028_09370 [Rhodocyclaceae bacterium]|nr:hypothetical protein [Rhodocyclaceae bacterium]
MPAGLPERRGCALCKQRCDRLAGPDHREQDMTHGEFVDILGVTVRLDQWPDDIPQRELRIEVERDAAGVPEAVSLDFIERGAGHFRIRMGDPRIAPGRRLLWVGQRMIPDGHRKADACRLIEDFLHQYSVLPPPASARPSACAA